MLPRCGLSGHVGIVRFSCARGVSDTMSAACRVISDRPKTEDVYTKCACSFHLLRALGNFDVYPFFGLCVCVCECSLSGRHQQQQSVSCFVAVGSIVDAVRRVYDTSLHMKSTLNERYVGTLSVLV